MKKQQQKAKEVPLVAVEPKQKQKTKQKFDEPSQFEATTIKAVRNFALYPKAFLARLNNIEEKKFISFVEPKEKVWIGKGKQLYIWNAEEIDDGYFALYSYGKLFYLQIENGKAKEL